MYHFSNPLCSPTQLFSVDQKNGTYVHPTSRSCSLLVSKRAHPPRSPSSVSSVSFNQRGPCSLLLLLLPLLLPFNPLESWDHEGEKGRGTATRRVFDSFSFLGWAREPKQVGLRLHHLLTKPPPQQHSAQLRTLSPSALFRGKPSSRTDASSLRNQEL